MSTSAERAAELRAEADALEALDGLEQALLAAKTAYEEHPTEENKAAKKQAALTLREARSQTRSEAVTVGGDAYVDEEV